MLRLSQPDHLLTSALTSALGGPIVLSAQYILVFPFQIANVSLLHTLLLLFTIHSLSVYIVSSIRSHTLLLKFIENIGKRIITFVTQSNATPCPVRYFTNFWFGDSSKDYPNSVHQLFSILISLF